MVSSQMLSEAVVTEKISGSGGRLQNYAAALRLETSGEQTSLGNC